MLKVENSQDYQNRNSIKQNEQNNVLLNSKSSATQIIYKYVKSENNIPINEYQQGQLDNNYQQKYKYQQENYIQQPLKYDNYLSQQNGESQYEDKKDSFYNQNLQQKIQSQNQYNWNYPKQRESDQLIRMENMESRNSQKDEPLQKQNLPQKLIYETQKKKKSQDESNQNSNQSKGYIKNRYTMTSPEGHQKKKIFDNSLFKKKSSQLQQLDTQFIQQQNLYQSQKSKSYKQDDTQKQIEYKQFSNLGDSKNITNQSLEKLRRSNNDKYNLDKNQNSQIEKNKQQISKQKYKYNELFEDQQGENQKQTNIQKYNDKRHKESYNNIIHKWTPDNYSQNQMFTQRNQLASKQQSYRENTKSSENGRKTFLFQQNQHLQREDLDKNDNSQLLNLQTQQSYKSPTHKKRLSTSPNNNNKIRYQLASKSPPISMKNMAIQSVNKIKEFKQENQGINFTAHQTQKQLKSQKYSFNQNQVFSSQNNLHSYSQSQPQFLGNQKFTKEYLNTNNNEDQDAENENKINFKKDGQQQEKKKNSIKQKEYSIERKKQLVISNLGTLNHSKQNSLVNEFQQKQNLLSQQQQFSDRFNKGNYHSQQDQQINQQVIKKHSQSGLLQEEEKNQSIQQDFEKIEQKNQGLINNLSGKQSQLLSNMGRNNNQNDNVELWNNIENLLLELDKNYQKQFSDYQKFTGELNEFQNQNYNLNYYNKQEYESNDNFFSEQIDEQWDSEDEFNDLLEECEINFNSTEISRKECKYCLKFFDKPCSLGGHISRIHTLTNIDENKVEE
ncbi:hypothetical protein PPERSA_03543 [Pseudocohnilembus persalinus]|uniref:C2H2-type domain-containing protein n=1 Tax=Pseudocohnilembus persalinus TaxID=266149 RepID=A0A0V0Q817_PSEPJ|nr:hypothetical protein PPERSA_03543 [Pseudocohnilembus persalinus]|eukprot:KRW98371.1 hypothetical protein PPERSA_03543 [Pseudocohnilembus persalinus]